MRMSLLGDDVGPEIVEGLDLKKIQETIKIVQNTRKNQANRKFIRKGSMMGVIQQWRNSLLLDIRTVRRRLIVLSLVINFR